MSFTVSFFPIEKNHAHSLVDVPMKSRGSSHTYLWIASSNNIYCFLSIICSIESLIFVMSRKKLDVQATHRQGCHCSLAVNPFFDSDQMGMRARALQLMVHASSSPQFFFSLSSAKREKKKCAMKTNCVNDRARTPLCEDTSSKYHPQTDTQNNKRGIHDS